MSHLKRWQTPSQVKAHREAQAKYQAKPEQKKKRAARNLARAHMEKMGKVHKGDGKDVNHADGDATNNNPKNWLVESRHKNRSYPRNKDASKKNPRD